MRVPVRYPLRAENSRNEVGGSNGDDGLWGCIPLQALDSGRVCRAEQHSAWAEGPSALRQAERCSALRPGSMRTSVKIFKCFPSLRAGRPRYIFLDRTLTVEVLTSILPSYYWEIAHKLRARGKWKFHRQHRAFSAMNIVEVTRV